MGWVKGELTQYFKEEKYLPMIYLFRVPEQELSYIRIVTINIKLQFEAVWSLYPAIFFFIFFIYTLHVV